MQRLRLFEVHSIEALGEAAVDFREPCARFVIATLLREQPRERISSATPYKWKSKYGGLEVSEARRLKSVTTPRQMCVHIMVSSVRLREPLKTPINFHQAPDYGSRYEGQKVPLSGSHRAETDSHPSP
jgi:hypothetical protein